MQIKNNNLNILSAFRVILKTQLLLPIEGNGPSLPFYISEELKALSSHDFLILPVTNSHERRARIILSLLHIEENVA